MGLWGHSGSGWGFLEGFNFIPLTFSFPSSVRERLKPEFLVSALMALMAPDFTSSLACSVAVAVSTGGWSDMAAVGGDSTSALPK